MIPRYSRPKIEKIWSLQNKFSILLEIECLIAEKLSTNGVIPKRAAKQIRKTARFNVKEIEKIEKETKHDVIAFLTNLAEYVGPKARFIHQGMTSSDVLDTCLNYQLKEAGNILNKDLDIFFPGLSKMIIASVSKAATSYILSIFPFKEG